MAKSSGLGQLLLVGGYDISGDVGSLQNVHGGPAALDMTGIDKSAHERIGGLLDGGLEFTAFFNPAIAGTHALLSALPTADVATIYASGRSIGSPALGLIAKQINYDGTRGADGMFTFAVSMQSNGYGIEWGDLLTAGLRTDTAATNGSSFDGTAATTSGWAAYLEVTAFTGTDVTVKLQDSANDSAFADVTGGGFTAIAGVTSQRIAGASGATLRRYVRAVTTTSGGVTSVTFGVTATRHPSGALT